MQGEVKRKCDRVLRLETGHYKVNTIIVYDQASNATVKTFCSAVAQLRFTAAADSNCAGSIDYVYNEYLEEYRYFDFGFGDCNVNSMDGWFKMFLERQSYVVQVKIYTPKLGR